MDLALFDFDGTLTDRDTWTPFIRRAVRPSRRALSLVLLTPVAVAYRFGWLSSSHARGLVHRVAFRGVPAEGVRRQGQAYARESLDATLRPEAFARLDWHRNRGDAIVIVSAGLDVYLAPWCEGRDVQLICTSLEERQGRLTGRFAGRDCAGDEKARRIRARYEPSRYDHVWAYGDSGDDRAMIEMADRKFYRWREITNWDEVTAFGHPSESWTGPEQQQ